MYRRKNNLQRTTAPDIDASSIKDKTVIASATNRFRRFAAISYSMIFRLLLFLRRHPVTVGGVVFLWIVFAFTGGFLYTAMRGGLGFQPFKLLSRKVVTEGSTFGYKVIQLTFALDDDDATLGFGQPTTAVKVRAPGSWFRARAYSVASPPETKGSFQLLVKVYPDGWVSAYLDTVKVGEDVYCARAFTKAMRPATQVQRLGLIAFGIGISDMLHTAKLHLKGGAEVRLVYAVRGREDVILNEELDVLVSAYPTTFTVRYHLSRDDNAASYGDEWHSGRLSEDTLKEIFGDWSDISTTTPSSPTSIATIASTPTPTTSTLATSPTTPTPTTTSSPTSSATTTSTPTSSPISSSPPPVIEVIGTKEMMQSTAATLKNNLGLSRHLLGPKGIMGSIWLAML